MDLTKPCYMWYTLITYLINRKINGSHKVMNLNKFDKKISRAKKKNI